MRDCLPERLSGGPGEQVLGQTKTKVRETETRFLISKISNIKYVSLILWYKDMKK